MGQRKQRQVALAFPLSPTHLIQTVQGIADYAAAHGRWILGPNCDTYRLSVLDLRGWKGDGVIAMIDDQREMKAAHALGVPVVNMSGRLRDVGMPTVMLDHRAAGRLAAEHLLERGFRRFGYYGFPGAWFAELRRRGFVERVEAAGCSCSVLHAPRNARQPTFCHDWLGPLKGWLQTLQPPVGIMAVFDARARMVVEACCHLGLAVPADVSVIGVDNHEAACQMCPVPLSSVSRNGYRVGLDAAAMLDRLMHGRRPPADHVLIPPDGIYERASTDVVAVEDALIRAVAQYIHEHVEEPFGVERLTHITSVSRRSLEQRFKACLNLTPHEFLCRARIERAKRLLVGRQNMSVNDVSTASGFREPRRFRLVFQRMTGMRPSEYRRSTMDNRGPG